MKRRAARKLALEILFESDLAGVDSLLVASRYRAKNGYDFAEQLVTGVTSNMSEIDALIENHSRDWTIERMPGVDRNVLRLAIYEITHVGTPAAIVIDEAIELAKNYSTEDSGRFVNGVLAQIVRDFTLA